MNVSNTKTSHQCQQLKKDFFNHFDWETTDISFSRINVQQRSIMTVSSDYDWHLCYWDNDLDLKLNERLIPGIRTWNQYSQAHTQLLKIKNKYIKIDICNQYENSFDLFSIRTVQPFVDIPYLLRLKGYLCSWSVSIWKKYSDTITLPFRSDVNLCLKQEINKPDLKINHIQFGHIRLTKKEMITVSCLLQHRQLKETAAIQQCSQTAEKKRLMNIRKKLGCTHQSNFVFFNALKKYGITAACLEDFTTFH